MFGVGVFYFWEIYELWWYCHLICNMKQLIQKWWSTWGAMNLYLLQYVYQNDCYLQILLHCLLGHNIRYNKNGKRKICKIVCLYWCMWQVSSSIIESWEVHMTWMQYYIDMVRHPYSRINMLTTIALCLHPGCTIET